jgi:hypothetical protein
MDRFSRQSLPCDSTRILDNRAESRIAGRTHIVGRDLDGIETMAL